MEYEALRPSHVDSAAARAAEGALTARQAATAVATAAVTASRTTDDGRKRAVCAVIHLRVHQLLSPLWRCLRLALRLHVHLLLLLLVRFLSFRWSCSPPPPRAEEEAVFTETLAISIVMNSTSRRKSGPFSDTHSTIAGSHQDDLDRARLRKLVRVAAFRSPTMAASSALNGARMGPQLGGTRTHELSSPRAFGNATDVLTALLLPFIPVIPAFSAVTDVQHAHPTVSVSCCSA
jgi:hypothetical protein